MNDGIPSEPCSLKYASVDDAVSIVKALGKGSLLVKIDLKDAYCMISVHPDDYHLLGVTWAMLSGHFRSACVQPQQSSQLLPISLHGSYTSMA